jgi:hypothetical protein
MNDPVDILAQLTKAGGMVGISNTKWWLDLTITYGPACVLAIVDEIHADTRQAVNVAVVAKRCEHEAKQKQDEADDVAEDAAMKRQVARTVPVVPVEKGAAAAAVSTPASVAAATDAHPVSPSTADHQETVMPTIKQHIHSMEDEIKRRGMTTKEAMVEMGTAPTAIYAWRKGNCGDRVRAKIEAWLVASPTTAGTAAAELAAETKPTKSQKVRRTPPVVEVVEQSTPSDLSSLLTQGANLRDALNALGSTGYADVVQQLVDRLSTMRAALGG